MNSSTEGVDGLRHVSRYRPSLPDNRVPLLEVRVFGGYDILLGGQPVESPAIWQRKNRELMCILALNHGQNLNSDYIANSMWPRSPLAKQRNCMNSQWYSAAHAVFEGKISENPYFERRHGICRLCDEHLRTDIEDVDWACNELLRTDLDSMRAVAAYRVLQASYRGDLLPGEMENAIIIRARTDWRDRVVESLSAASQTMHENGDDRTALWMATVASRLEGMREDVVRLRMSLFKNMGMPAYAVKAYDELVQQMRNEMGIDPSPQSVALMEQVIDGSGLAAAMAPHAPLSRRRGRAKSDGGSWGMASLSLGEVPPTPLERVREPM